MELWSLTVVQSKPPSTHEVPAKPRIREHGVDYLDDILSDLGLGTIECRLHVTE